MALRLSGQNSIFGVVFFVSKSLLGIERQKKLEKFAILTRKPRSHARILIYRTWPKIFPAIFPCCIAPLVKFPPKQEDRLRIWYFHCYYC